MYDQGPQATTGHLDLLDALPIMILDVDRDGNLLFANKKVRERLGLPTVLEDITLANVLDDGSQAEAMRQLQELFSGEGDITSTWKLRVRGGGLIQVDTNAVSIYENGYPVRVRTYLHDGSEVAAAPAPAPVQAFTGPADVRAALKEEQEYTKALIQKSGLLVYILDTKNNVVEVNKKMEEVTGFSREMTPTLDVLLSGLYPDAKYRGIVERIHQNMYKNQHIRETELSITTRAGELKHISWSTARLKNAAGQVHGFIAMGVEVSEKKRLEQWVKLQTSFFDRVGDGVVVSDLKGIIINWVGGSERMLGYSAKDMVGKPLADLFPADYRDEVSTALHNGIERDGKWSGEMVLASAEGRKLAIRLDAAVILNEKGAAIATVSVLHDQTREKQLEAQLADARSDLEGTRSDSEEYNRMIREREQAVAEAQARNDELERRIEYLGTKNRDIESEANRLAAERAGLEEVVKELQIYHLQVLGAGAAIVTLDPLGTVLTWSRGVEELTGIEAREAFNRHHDEVFKLDEFDWEMIQSEASQKSRVNLPCTVVRRDGTQQPIQLEITVLNDDAGQPISFIEVATLPAAAPGLGEEFVQELVQAKNLATLGELSVGIAREVGDVYSALSANLKRLRDYTGDLKKVVELYRNGVSNRDIEGFVRRVDLRSILSDLDFLFDESQEGVVRVRNLARDLSSYLPGVPEDARVLQVNELVESALSLVRSELHNRARIEKHYGDPSLLLANQNMALRLLINLLLASVRSFEQVHSTRNEIRLQTLLDGSQVVIEVGHNGKPVGQEVIDNLGDAAFLARQPGLVPLSLGQAHQLASALGGSLKVAPQNDGGTAFRVSLPASDSAPDLTGADDEERTEPHGNVLFIDDDKNQLRSYRRYFERFYHVFQADNADEVLNTLSVRQDFSAVVMDLLMPEADGIKLYKQLVERYPQLKERVVFLAPVGLSPETRDFLTHSGRVVLYKPMDMDSLATILQTVARLK